MNDKNEENISKEQAKGWRENYVVSEKALGREDEKADYSNGNYLVKGYILPRADIEVLLENNEIAGFTAYHGLNENGGKELILCPYNNDGFEIGDIIWAPLAKCPPYCYRIFMPDGEFSP